MVSMQPSLSAVPSFPGGWQEGERAVEPREGLKREERPRAWGALATERALSRDVDGDEDDDFGSW